MKKCIHDWLAEQFGEDDALIGDVYGEYVTSSAQNLVDADRALAANDFLELDRLAHTIKGNALTVGDAEFADAAVALRNASKVFDGPGCAVAVALLHALQPAS